MAEIHYPPLVGRPVTWTEHEADWHPTLAGDVRCTVCGAPHPSENR